MAKRKCALFSSYEKEVLLELVSARKDILDIRTKNLQSICQKEECWRQLTSEFHSRIGVSHRTQKQLKSLWRNLNYRGQTTSGSVKRPYKKSRDNSTEVLIDATVDKIWPILPLQFDNTCTPNSYDDDDDDDAVFDGDVSENQCSPDENSSVCVKTEVVHDGFSPSIVHGQGANHALDQQEQRLQQTRGDQQATENEHQPEARRKEPLNNLIYSSYRPIKPLSYRPIKPKADIGIMGKRSLFDLPMAEREHKRKMEIMEKEHQLMVEYWKEKREQEKELYRLKLEILTLKQQKLSDE